ncbi:MAG: DUF5715 family protein [Flavobacteriales bacterium]|nr:DUF5715 family protein [Flavobacteriales bacterium]
MTRNQKKPPRTTFGRLSRKRAFRKALVYSALGLIVLFSLFALYKAGSYAFTFITFDEVDEGVLVEEVVVEKEETTENPTPTKSKEVCSCTNHSIKFKRNHYDIHREQARRLNNGVLLTDEKIKNLSTMVQVENEEGFVIDRHKLTHSHAYLNREAYKVLIAMGNAYSEKVEGTKAEGSVFHISSLSRSLEQQKKLLNSAHGRNATRKVSAHSYGASFDIWKIEGAENCHAARKAFETVLKDFQKQGKILLCPEGNCIHVTVKKG